MAVDCDSPLYRWLMMTQVIAWKPIQGFNFGVSGSSVQCLVKYSSYEYSLVFSIVQSDFPRLLDTCAGVIKQDKRQPVWCCGSS